MSLPDAAVATVAANTALPTPLAQAIVADAVQRIEHTGPLDDAAELREAFAARPTRAAQFLHRAWLLGQRLGLPPLLAQGRTALHWATLALALAVALSALGTARAVLADDRSINAVAAFTALLGLHLLALALWLGSLPWALRARPGHAASHPGSPWLGRLALPLAAWLAARWPGTPVALPAKPHAAPLLHASAAVLQRQRLWPWLLGAISHGVWALAFVLVLGALAFGFAFQAYRLSWETTILGSDFFVRFVQLTGWLPAQLGFAVPDAATVRQAASGMLGTSGTAMNAGAGGQRAWAFWLLGCVAVYGLLPRAVLAALCLWRWRAGLARLAEADAVVDTASPYVRRIFTRLDALAPAQVVDAEQRPPAAALPPPAPAGQPGTLALIGFERPPELPWPPEGWPATLRAQPLLNLAGSSAERQAALAQLAATRPWRLLVACAPHASPDRGTARFLREAARHATHAALWLPEAPMPAADPADPAAPASADARGPARWRDWLQAEDLAPRISVLHGPQAAAWAGEDAPLAAPAPATHNA